MKEETIKLELKDNRLRLIINGKIHLFLNNFSDFVGFQSWIGDNNRYYIEFYTKTQDFFTEYDTNEKWSAVLNLLNEKL